jgi:hypothetical protein
MQESGDTPCQGGPDVTGNEVNTTLVIPETAENLKRTMEQDRARDPKRRKRRRKPRSGVTVNAVDKTMIIRATPWTEASACDLLAAPGSIVEVQVLAPIRDLQHRWWRTYLDKGVFKTSHQFTNSEPSRRIHKVAFGTCTLEKTPSVEFSTRDGSHYLDNTYHLVVSPYTWEFILFETEYYHDSYGEGCERKNPLFSGALPDSQSFTKEELVGLVKTAAKKGSAKEHIVDELCQKVLHGFPNRTGGRVEYKVAIMRRRWKKGEQHRSSAEFTVEHDDPFILIKPVPAGRKPTSFCSEWLYPECAGAFLRQCLPPELVDLVMDYSAVPSPRTLVTTGDGLSPGRVKGALSYYA